MSDPRASNGYEQSNAEYLTFAYDSTIVFDATQSGGSASVGLAVTLVGNAQVGLTQDGNLVYGKLIRVKSDGYCSVQVDGGCTLPAGNGATVTAGSKIVGALGSASAKGYIRNVTATTGSYVQATATEAQKARCVILDASVTTAVVVDL